MSDEEWRYKAEGNKHIVFCNYKGQVLRLKKSTKVCECNGVICQKCKGTNNSELQELNYQLFVVMPLMKNSLACKCPSRIRVSSLLIDHLNETVQMHRPLYRRQKSLIKTDFGILMEDKTLLHPSPAISDLLATESLNHDTFCVEIKLKKGFMSLSDPACNSQVCKFCSLQMFRTFNDGKKGKLSYFCPIKLFSGNRKAMVDTLKALVECPQNTFRVFKNGETVYSQEIFDKLKQTGHCKTGNGLFEEVISSAFSINGDNLSEQNHLDEFYNLICSALLTPLDNSPQINLALQGSKCRSQFFKSPFLRGFNALKKQYNSSDKISFGYDDPNVPSTSILGLVLSCQLLSNIDYSHLAKVYASIIHKRDIKAISELDGPYDNQSWRAIGGMDTHANHQHFLLAATTKSLATTNTSNQQTLLQRYLVSKSFCDCSVMLTVKNVTGLESSLRKCLTEELQTGNSLRKSMILLNSLGGSSFIVSVSVVDIDPKPSSRIPLYCQQHEKIKNWWENEMFIFDQPTQ